MFKGKMPDLTLADFTAILTWALTQLVAYGWIDDETSKLTLSGTGTLIALGLKARDAYTRGKRNDRLAAEATAKAAVEVSKS